MDTKMTCLKCKPLIPNKVQNTTWKLMLNVYMVEIQEIDVQKLIRIAYFIYKSTSKGLKGVRKCTL